MNMFPLTVTVPAPVDGQADPVDRTYKTCRMVYDGRDTTIWWWDGNEFVIVFEAAVAPGGTGPSWWFKTDHGTVTAVRRDGCGCGHPLKAQTPTRTRGARRVYTGPEVADA